MLPDQRFRGWPPREFFRAEKNHKVESHVFPRDPDQHSGASVRANIADTLPVRDTTVATVRREDDSEDAHRAGRVRQRGLRRVTDIGVSRGRHVR